LNKRVAAVSFVAQWQQGITAAKFGTKGISTGAENRHVDLYI